MTIVVIESIGFCATHSISKMLKGNERNFVSHGTKNFKKNTKIGEENLSFKDFHNQMIEQSEYYDNCVSVHTNFNPKIIAEVTQGTTTKFIGLVRKSQYRQILSCFYWAINNFLNGRENFTKILTKIQINNSSSIKQIGLPVNMNTCLMWYAFSHVINFNLQLLINAPKILFMEDVIARPAIVIDKIGLVKNNKISPKVEQGPSHKNKVKDYQFLFDAEEILKKFFENMNIKIGTKTHKINEIEKLFFDKSIMENNIINK
tara:strand:- start:203 stop:982 length:780 start_codon:yes stop_codon:yes gene_type:complete